MHIQSLNEERLRTKQLERDREESVEQIIS